MPGLLRTLLIIVLVYYGFKLLRFLIIGGLKAKFNKYQNPAEPKARPEGDVKVENVSDDYKKSAKNSDGDYTSFEEIKE